MPILKSPKRKKIILAGILSVTVACTVLMSLPITRYLIIQGFFQAKILLTQRAIRDYLRSPDIDGETRRKLHLVEEIRDYGKSIGLNNTRSYRSIYDTGTEPVAYAVTAAYPDRLVTRYWKFPIVGKVPYLGFFRKKDALSEKAKLEKMGLDVVVRPVYAYSTIGILPDPLYSSMLKGSEAYLANIVLHEMTHETVFIKSDMKFNESLASFVGNQGSLDFLRSRYGEGSEKYIKSLDLKHDEELFAEFMGILADELEKFYDSKLSRQEKLEGREVIFTRARERFLLEIMPRMKTTTYSWFSSAKINNALILLNRHYHGEYELFEKLFRTQNSDLSATILFLSALDKNSDMREAVQNEIIRFEAQKKSTVSDE